MLLGLLINYWAHSVAKSAVGALRGVDDRVGKAFVVVLHLDALSGASLSASTASATIFFVDNLNHISEKEIFYSSKLAL